MTIGFTATEAAQILGATRRAVMDWGGRGIVGADVHDSVGCGSRRVYSAINLVEMAVARELFRLAMTRENVRHLLDQWRKPANKRPTFEKWFNPLRGLRSGVEWLIIVDAQDWFVRWERSGLIKTGKGILSSPEKKIPQARQIIAINLTKIKEKISTTL